MNRKVALFAVLAFLFGCAFAQQSANSSSIQLSVHESTNGHWIAVKPTEDDNITTKIEMMESSSNDWVEMLGNSIWGYWQMWSTSANGFTAPISFRLTSDDGEQVILDNVMTTVSGGLLETGVQFASKAAGRNGNGNQHGNGNEGGHNSGSNNGGHHTNTEAPTAAPSTGHHTNTQAPSAAPSTGHHTNTQAPTDAPTDAPTSAPTTHHSSGAATQAPTSKPTSKPTTKPSSSSGSSSSGSGAIKLLVPLYVDPGSEWDELITAANAGANNIIAIINPDNGPVSSGPDSSYTTYMQKFADAGIEMVGYVHTLYGDRAVSDVEADVATYATKYPGLKGIFVDETSADASEVSYYTGLNSNILSKSGYVYNIINPGTVPDQGYANAATNIVVFESPASQWENNFPSWVTGGSRSAFSAIAYAASQSQMSSLLSEMKASNMGMVYVTDGASGCCTYNDLVSFFSAEASAVAAL